MSATENFRLNVRRALELLDLSQTDLARQAGLSRVHLNMLLHRRTEPSLAICEQLAEALGISTSLLIDEPVVFQRGLKKFRRALTAS